MSYVTAFAAAVPNTDKDIYIKHIQQSADLFKKHGADHILECWGSDVPVGEITSFPRAVKCKPDETVVIGIVQWPSKEAHDQGMQNVMDEMRDGIESGTLSKPPFDGKHMIFGGFEVILNMG